MNDPDETAIFPVFEVRGDKNGVAPRSSSSPADTIYPRPDTTVNGAVLADADPIRFEPTVFGAVRRYRFLVVAVGIVLMIAAIGYSVTQAKVYQAQANVTVPLPVSSTATAADPGQYLDSQVVLLQSQPVAQQAAAIANRQLGTDRLDTANFSTAKGGSLTVTPPTTTTAGTYGASIVTVSFTGPSAQVAQVGLKAVIQAFDNAISNNIKAQASAAIAGINKAIKESYSTSQLANLEAERNTALINEQTNLAQPPTAAVQPTVLANGHWTRNGAIGLVVGLIVGAIIAYALAFRRRSIAGRQDPRAIYNAPMIAETPAIKNSKEPHLPATRSRLPMAADPGSAVAEAFRFAANSVNRASRARGGSRPSIAFISPRAGAGKSLVVANLALAMAEGGAQVLVVDADITEGGLTARLLCGGPVTGGAEQVVSGARTLMDCVQQSPLNDRVYVLGADRTALQRITGPAHAEAARSMLATAKANFDVVLIDSPAMLQVANASDLVNVTDTTIVIVNPNDRLQDHLEMVEVLKSLGPGVLGYLYNQPLARANIGHYLRDLPHVMPAPPAVPGSPAPIVDSPQLNNGSHQPSGQLQD